MVVSVEQNRVESASNPVAAAVICLLFQPQELLSRLRRKSEKSRPHGKPTAEPVY
jgi:hypothetical protein